MTKRTSLIPPVGLILLCAALSSAWAEGEPAPNRTGLPGFWDTIAPPNPRSAGLRFGVYGETGIIDDGHGFDDPRFLPNIRTSSLYMQLGLKLSPGFLVTGSMPYRMWKRDASPDLEGAEGEGWGDLQIGATVRMFAMGGGAFRVGGWGVLSMPTGDANIGLSTGKTEGEYGLHTMWVMFQNSTLPETRWYMNFGYRVNKNERDGYGMLTDTYADIDSTGVFRPQYPAAAQPLSSRANDMLLLRTAVEFRKDWARLVIEYSVDWLYEFDDAKYSESAQWLTPSLQIGGQESLAFKASWAIGLWKDDPGTPFRPAIPDWMASAALTYPFFWGGRDTDRDGVPDKKDACPDQAEDVDGYQDDDGCPDPDNDGDGIPDRYDLAPMLIEDIDGFQDDDGRPDLDNDFDGIPDVDDECPDDPEDFDGFEDDDGCPDVVMDADGDGILDADDICPEEAEDFDGFEDDDGCPDPDNDLDGVPDDQDQCPDEREDYDGDRDDDGCPDNGNGDSGG